MLSSFSSFLAKKVFLLVLAALVTALVSSRRHSSLLTPGMTSAVHPFYPKGLTLVGYVPKELSVLTIFGTFAACLLSIFAATRAYAKRNNPNLNPRDRNIAIWFALSGAIHLIIEGYFSINHMTMPARTDWLGQAWKEYSNCDSRYMTADPFVVCMETITAWAWGPLSLLTTYLIVKGSPWRHAVQIIVSGGQFYGDALYFMTNIMDEWYRGISYSRPEPLYYWGYFVGMNLIWIIIPTCEFNSYAREYIMLTSPRLCSDEHARDCGCFRSCASGERKAGRQYCAKEAIEATRCHPKDENASIVDSESLLIGHIEKPLVGRLCNHMVNVQLLLNEFKLYMLHWVSQYVQSCRRSLW